MITAAEAHSYSANNSMATKLYRQALQRYPSSGEVHMAAALFLGRLDENIREAHMLARRAMRLNSSLSRVHFRGIFRKKHTLHQNQLERIDKLKESFTGSAVDRFAERVYHTCAIEGNSLSLAVVRRILRNATFSDAFEAREVLGAGQAEYAILANRGRVEVTRLHEMIFSRVGLGNESGKFRNNTVYIAGHRPPCADEVPARFHADMLWLRDSVIAAEMHPGVRAAIHHWHIASLHPFVDGNGRTSRAAMNSVLVRSGFPPIMIRVEDRFRYFEACRVAQIDNNRAPLIDMVLDALEIELGKRV